MRKIVLIATIMTLLVAFQVAALPTGLVGWWQLDQNAEDSSDNNFDGTLIGTENYEERAGFGYAHLFDGATYFQIPRDPLLEPQNIISVEAWVKRDGSPGAYKHIVAKGSIGCGSSSYAFYTGGSGGLSFYVTTAGYKLSPSVAPAAIWDNEWHHIAGTYDGAYVRLYVDGVEVGTGTSATGNIVYPVEDLYFGRFNEMCGGYNYFQYSGYLDDVRIWNIALTADQLAYYDQDFDWVFGDDDKCAGTVVDVPDENLGVNRHVWYGGDYFTTLVPAKKGTFIEEASPFSMADTLGCSCEQILQKLKDEFGAQMVGHWNFGCSKSVMDDFVLDMSDGVFDGLYLLDTVTVPSNQNIASAVEVIMPDQTYILEASGTYQYATWAGIPVADAKCSWRGTADPLGYINQWLSGDLLPSPYTNYLEIKVNGGVVDWGVPSGTCNADNIYKMEITGVDHLDFNIYDGGATGDNSGSITVKIFAQV
ncbi:LamG domain-containing protein [Candidatus Woesearchaeota archaeon]|nr:LamG domain-containing protein [Candidatus Woesearchaeota archaeon]